MKERRRGGGGVEGGRGAKGDTPLLAVCPLVFTSLFIDVSSQV